MESAECKLRIFLLCTLYERSSLLSSQEVDIIVEDRVRIGKWTMDELLITFGTLIKRKADHVIICARGDMSFEHSTHEQA